MAAKCSVALCAATAILSFHGHAAAVLRLPQGGADLGGVQQVWYVSELSFQHDTALDEGDTPNPFYDFRLDVTFTHVDSGTTLVVPGFFDTDGQAADTGFTRGDRWRVRFVPDRSGTWSWSASFRTGTAIAVADDASGGAPASFDGASGSFLVHPADPEAPGLRAKGMLRYGGERYLRFAWNREAFLKVGADSPENLLGYWEFDGTFDTGGDPNGLDAIDGLHRFGPHVADYDTLGGGPTWAGGKGRGLLGALDYLASVGVNSVYFLTYNIDGGDGGEVFPWASTGSKLRYDVSKLAQWERVFDHMTDLGLVLHVVMQEEENDTVLDFGQFGDQRKLYHRELVARFGCNLGLVWNLGEETSNSDADRKAFASHLRALDPYDHPIAVHTNPSQLGEVYGPLLGFQDVELCSLQVSPEEVHDRTLEWGDASAVAGRPWVVTCDEQNPAEDGVVPDAFDPFHDTIREEVLWGNLLAGGGGVEYYFGYGWPHDDLDCEDFRTRATAWSQAAGATAFLRAEVDVTAMRPADELTSQSAHRCLALDGEVYLVHVPPGAAPVLDLEGFTDTFTVEWYDSFAGGELRSGQEDVVAGPGRVSLGRPPEGSRDWIALVRRVAERRPVASDFVADVVVDGEDTSMLFALHATDPDGPGDVVQAGMFLFDETGASQGFYALPFAGGDLYALRSGGLKGVGSGTWSYVAGALDATGGVGFVTGTFDVP